MRTQIYLVSRLVAVIRISEVNFHTGQLRRPQLPDYDLRFPGIENYLLIKSVQ